MRILVFDDPQRFREQARPWLLRREAENNLLIGLCDRLADGTYSYEPPLLLALAVGEDGVCGCAFRTPPFKLGLTRLPTAAMEPLVEAVAELYPDLTEVLGPEDSATAFAAAWCRRHGGDWRRGMPQGIFELREVTWPSTVAAGTLQPGGDDDLPLAIEWLTRGAEDMGVYFGEPEPLAETLIEAGDLFLWIDGRQPVSMAAVAARTPHGARIGYVYTPPALRGRGYASAAVATLSATELERGRDLCFLYADLDNPVSTGIYRRLGYRLISRGLDCELVAARSG